MRIVGFTETSLLDWHGRIAAVLWIGGCDFACPFCHNYRIADDDPELTPVPWEDIARTLRRKRDWYDGVVLTGGEVSDVKGYGPVMAEPGPAPKVMLGDKGYDADAILADLDARGVAAIIPPKRNRTVQRDIDDFLYALRNLVERCFSKLKHSRRLATRYDKTAESYIGFILVASIRLWVRHFVNRT